MNAVDKAYAERRSEPRPEPEPLEPSPTFIWATIFTLAFAAVSMFILVVSLG